MGALLSIAAHVTDIPGRKSLVWMTANLPFSGLALARAMSRANLAIYPIDARGLLPRSVGNSRADEAAAVIFGRVGGSPSQGSSPAGISTMEELAERTGGRAFSNTNDLTGAICEGGGGC
jgi:VWFA-related protein